MTVELSDGEKRNNPWGRTGHHPEGQMIRETSYADIEIKNDGKNHVGIHQRNVSRQTKVSKCLKRF